MWDGKRPTLPKARENAERQIQIHSYKNLTFMKSHNLQDNKFKAARVVNPANMSDLKAFRRKQTMLLSEDSTIVNKREHISTLQARHKTQK
jgi:hypothetical protein